MNTVVITPSHLKEKKLNAVVNETKTIPFGQKGASDYTIHKDDERKTKQIHSKTPKKKRRLDKSLNSWVLFLLRALE